MPELSVPSQNAEDIRAEAYQVIGVIATAAGLFDHPEVTRALDYFAYDHPQPDILPYGAGLPDGDDPAECIACEKPIATGMAYYPDEGGGFIHAACCGPEREGYTKDGEPLGPDDEIPAPSIW